MTSKEQAHLKCSRLLERLTKLLLPYHSFDWEGNFSLHEEIDQAMSDLAKLDLSAIGLSSYCTQRLLQCPRAMFSLEETFELLFESDHQLWLIALQGNNPRYRDDLLMFFDTRGGQSSYFYETNYADPALMIRPGMFEDGDKDIVLDFAKKRFGDKFTKFNGRCMIVVKWQAKWKQWQLDKIYCFDINSLSILLSV